MPGSGWPGLPETMRKIFGVTTNFRPEKITISRGFGMMGCFSVSMNAFPNAPSNDFVVPAEHLASHPQPDYPMVPRGTMFTVVVKNLTRHPAPCGAQVTGKDVKTERDA